MTNLKVFVHEKWRSIKIDDRVSVYSNTNPNTNPDPTLNPNCIEIDDGTIGCVFILSEIGGATLSHRLIDYFLIWKVPLSESGEPLFPTARWRPETKKVSKLRLVPCMSKQEVISLNLDSFFSVKRFSTTLVLTL